jgi:hypothetical protein
VPIPGEMVLLEALGLCEHCGAMMSIQNMPADAADADWPCPKCKKKTTHKTFGYENIGGDWKRTKWVGKDGKWTSVKPTEDFPLGNLLVVMEMPRFFP